MGSSELYRTLVESSAEGMWALDDSGRTVFANPRLAQMLRVPREELVGRDHADFLDEAGRAQWRGHVTRLADGRAEPLPVDCRFVRGDGVAVWFLVTESRLVDSEGRPSGVLLSLSEYDDRRRLQTALAENERQLLDAQRIARMGSWSWDAVADRLTVSPTVHDVIELDGSRFPLTLAEALDTFDQAERERLRVANRPMLDGETGSATFDVAASGTEGPVWLRVRAVAQRDPDGVLVGVSGTVQDVTESRQAEDTLRDLAHQNMLMQRIAVAANQSPSLLEALYATGELVVGHDDWTHARAFWPAPDEPDRLVAGPSIGRSDELGDPALPARELATAERAFAAGRSVWDDVRRLTLACPIMLGDEPVAVIAISSDPPLHRHAIIASMLEQVALQLSTVAEREATARELATARDAAMEASRQKSEFLATMSHEIRTPLNGVIGLNDLLRATELDTHQQRLTTGVAASGRALLAIVDDILDFSKIEAGLLELEEIDVDPRQLLDDVAAMTVESATARGVELVVHCDRDVPDLVRGDRTRLVQVVSNLVSNAVKFTADGEVVVRAALVDGPHGPGDPQLRIEVRDTGVGISPERVQGVFDPFIQADASTTREYGGTGLGLAIVREIVAALGGEVGVTSEPGVGSTFWFTARVRTPVAPGPRTDTDLTGRSVLVVDPLLPRREADVETLAHWGVDVADAEPAAAGQVWARAEREGRAPDLVLLSAGDDDLGWTVPDGVVVVRLHGPGQQRAGERYLERPVPASRLREALGAALRGAELPPGPSVVRDAARDVTRIGGPAPGTSRGRVLVVEDTPINQLVAEGLLAALGYAAESVDDGVCALARLAEEDAAFDLVLMDVQMPRLDGYATSRAIRERERAAGSPRMPIVAMTATAVTGERERCLDAGMDDFLTKPVSPARLATVLADHLADAARADGAGPGGTDCDGSPPESCAEDDGPAVPADLRAHLDLERMDMLRDLDPGNTAYLDRVIGNFVSRTPGLAATVREAVEASDAAALTAAAHRLRGSALNLGVPRVAEVALALELMGESGDLAGADGPLEQLEALLERGRAAVLAYRAAYLS